MKQSVIARLQITAYSAEEGPVFKGVTFIINRKKE
jgi:hypothetical protein